MATSLSSMFVSLVLLYPAPREPEPSHFGIGYLGVQLSEQDGGVVVSRVVPDTPASGSPLREKDRIVKIDGRDIRDTNDSRSVIQSLRPGSTYEIEIKRGDETIRFRVKPIPKPE
jgi:S1-C subfamily serine protease